MARLGYWGFTVQVVPIPATGNGILIWAGAGTELVTIRKIEEDAERLVELMEERNNFKHWNEVWQ